MNDIVINKIQSIQRCIHRARKEYHADAGNFDTNFTAQDAATLNVLRGCEQAIDLANHVIKSHKLGIPTSSRESFDLLAAEGIIPPLLAERLKKMVHFRNTIIHEYQQLNLEILKCVIGSGLDDLIELGDQVMAFLKATR